MQLKVSIPDHLSPVHSMLDQPLRSLSRILNDLIPPYHQVHQLQFVLTIISQAHPPTVVHLMMVSLRSLSTHPEFYCHRLVQYQVRFSKIDPHL